MNINHGRHWKDDSLTLLPLHAMVQIPGLVTGHGSICFYANKAKHIIATVKYDAIISKTSQRHHNTDEPAGAALANKL